MSSRGSRVGPGRGVDRRPPAPAPARAADLARRVSELFASGRDLETLWGDLCKLVAATFGARRVTLAFRGDDGDRVAYAADDGAMAAPANSRPVPGSPLARVLASERFLEAGTTLGAPLLFGRRLVGALVVEGEQRYDATEIALLESCALFLAARVHDEEASRRSERYEALAFTDALTGIANRRKFDEALASEWKRAARTHLPLALVMLDIDFFKAFNDTYGHQGGDRCLQLVARALRECVSRPGDVVARYGGEEFVALLPDTPLEGGIALAEAFRTAVARAAIAHGGSSLGTVSLSVGVASSVPDGETDAQALVRDADAALYRAKEAGRNRVIAGEYASVAESVQRAAGAARTNLPSPATRTIGRAKEIAHLRKLLADSRLVCVVGVGGSGKTRLALHVAGERLDAYEHGVWFVDLSALSDPALVAPAIAEALSLQVPAGENGTGALVKMLRRRNVLLVLDNCEHLRDAVASVVAQVSAECPGASVLATSRAALGAEGETVYRLPLLALAPEGAIAAADAAAFDAVALFVERAKAAKPSFALTDANAAAVAQVCRLVEGIALGIELTAPRIAVVSVEALAQRLSESFGILRAARRTELARHQTMRALIDWSYDLLTDAERRLFRRLAIFAGGWTLEAAGRACADEALDPFDLFDLHAQLLDKSLVVDDPSAQGRFRLLEPVREYARERLEQSGETRDVARRHAECFAQLAQGADEEFYTTPSRVWFAAVQSELGNYRAALAWSLGEGDAPELGAALAGALSWYFYYSSPAEGVRWTRAALARLSEDAPAATQARLYLGLAPLYGLPPAEKRSAGERAVELYRSVGDLAHLAHALRMLGLTLAWYFTQERAAAEKLIEEAGMLAASLRDPISIALVLQARSQVLDAADLAGRRKLKEEAYELLRVHGNDRQVSVVLTDLSEGAFAEGNEASAFEYGREALRVAQLSGSINTMLCAGINLAHYGAALRDWQTARDAAVRSLRWAEESQASEFVTFAVNAVACIAAGSGDSPAAARLFGFCNARFGSLHAPRHDGMCEDVMYRRTFETLRGALGEAELDRALAEGAALCEDDAVELARKALEAAAR